VLLADRLHKALGDKANFVAPPPQYAAYVCGMRELSTCVCRVVKSVQSETDLGQEEPQYTACWNMYNYFGMVLLRLLSRMLS
jgi:hypothetical protein